MIIREMTWDDLPGVVALDRENFDPVEQWSENGFLTHLLRDDTIYLVAEEEDAAASGPEAAGKDTEKPAGTISGYAGMITSFSDGDVTKLSVRKECRRRGIGRALLCGMLEMAAEKQVVNVYLEVRVSNEPAIRLYEACGFEKIGVRRRYYLSPPEDAAVMQYTAGQKKKEELSGGNADGSREQE